MPQKAAQVARTNTFPTVGVDGAKSEARCSEPSVTKRSFPHLTMGNLCPHRPPPLGGWYRDGNQKFEVKVKIEISSNCDAAGIGKMTTGEEMLVTFDHNEDKALKGAVLGMV